MRILGLRADIKEKGIKKPCIFFDYYLSPEEGGAGIVYALYKKPEVYDDLFTGKMCEEITCLLDREEKNISSRARYIFDFSSLGEEILSDLAGFVSFLKLQVVKFDKKKKVILITCRSGINVAMNRGFAKLNADSYREFYAIGPFDGDLDELILLEGACYTPAIPVSATRSAELAFPPPVKKGIDHEWGTPFSNKPEEEAG